MKHKIEQGSLILNAIQMDGFPEMVEVLNSLLGKFITFIENDCGYSGSVYYLMFNFFNHSFLRISLLIERKIIKIGGRPLMVPLPMNIGRLPANRLKLWKEWNLVICG